jgi:hypothetical protein
VTGRFAGRIAIAAALVVALGLLAFFAFRFLLRDLENRVAGALGPGAQVGRVAIDRTAVEITDLVLPGGDGWPAPESLRAARVRVVPSWASLLGEEIEIARIEVDGLEASALRTREGSVRVLPTLLGGLGTGPTQPASKAAEGQQGPRVSIGEIQITRGSLDLYDATIARKPWKLHLADVEASVRDIRSPALDVPVAVRVRAVLDGPRRDGSVSLSGWIVPPTRDLELHLALGAIDLLAMRPYLVEATKASLAGGTLDLALDSKVKDKRLHAPGRLVLRDLAFAPGSSARSRVLGVPRDLLLAGMRARGGQIALDFSLDGSIDDPAFSLNETVSTRLAVELANELGVSVGGLVEGTLGISRDGVRGAGEAVQGIGSALKKLMPRR